MPIVSVVDEDPGMRAAMEKARASFRYLVRELTWEQRRIVPALDLAMVKAAFADKAGGKVEHMWIGELSYNGEVVRGVLMNDPHELKSMSAGDAFELPLEQVEDWLYAFRDRAYGGFTIQVLRADMSSKERKEHDEAWGLEFGKPEQVALAAFGDPEAEHPMSEDGAAGLADAVAKDPETFIEGTDDDGLTLLHSLALGGSAAGVRVLLAAGAPAGAKTKGGKTARQLAEAMGWPRVVEQLHAAGG